jgi:hypothetical protein
LDGVLEKVAQLSETTVLKVQKLIKESEDTFNKRLASLEAQMRKNESQIFCADGYKEEMESMFTVDQKTEK